MRREILLVMAFTVLIVGCAHDPYRHRVLSDGNGGTKSYFFAYGKFCGPGYPPLKAGYSDIAKQTVDMWPPTDQLDATCYAHDLCYEQGGITAVCDVALQQILIRGSGHFIGHGCHRLAGDMAVAFFAHCGIKGEDNAATAGDRAACWVVGVPIAAFFAVTEAPLMLRKFPKEENTCNDSSNPDFVGVIHEFEERYRKSIVNHHHVPIHIPLPPDVGASP